MLEPLFPFPPEVPEPEEPEFPLPEVPELFEFEELSAGFVTCSSSSEPLEPSEHEINVNTKLSARMHATAAWGG